MTASVPSARLVPVRAVSRAGALVLTIAGNILVLGILAVAALGVVAAAAAVFGPAVFAAL
jgi:hypothetical protein